MPRHTEDDNNVGSQPGHVTPENQSGSLCTGSDISRSESVDMVHPMRHASKQSKIWMNK